MEVAILSDVDPVRIPRTTLGVTSLREHPVERWKLHVNGAKHGETTSTYEGAMAPWTAVDTSSEPEFHLPESPSPQQLRSFFRQNLQKGLRLRQQMDATNLPGVETTIGATQQWFPLVSISCLPLSKPNDNWIKTQNSTGIWQSTHATSHATLKGLPTVQNTWNGGTVEPKLLSPKIKDSHPY